MISVFSAFRSSIFAGELRLLFYDDESTFLIAVSPSCSHNCNFFFRILPSYDSFDVEISLNRIALSKLRVWRA